MTVINMSKADHPPGTPAECHGPAEGVVTVINTQAEVRFKFVVRMLIRRNVYPGATAIRNAIRTTWPGYGWEHDDLNGRQCKWRDSIFSTLSADHWVRVKHRANGGIELDPPYKGGTPRTPDHARWESTDVMHVSNNSGRGSSDPIPFPVEI